jgi:phenylacetic acid degradation operon negative regulatory protein
MVDAILSTLRSAPTSDFIYSSLSAFGGRHGGELPGFWFVDALGSLEIEEQAVRQTLFRLERRGALLTRRSGRVKFYRPSPAASAVLEAGRARVRQRIPRRWDGLWTLVHFRIGEEDRKARDGLRDVLLVEGFARLGPALYLHPRDRTVRFLTAAGMLGLSDRIHVFRGERIAGLDDRGLVAALWEPGEIVRRYRAFIARFLPAAGAPARRWTDRLAFATRFAVMFEFFRISWDDPGLPLSLVPPDWPGEEARALAWRLTRILAPMARRYAERFFSKPRPQALPGA